MADKRVGLEVDVNSESVGTYEKKVSTATGQLKKLKQELAGMDKDSPGFKKLAVEAAKLEDKIGDVRQEVKTLASDTFKLDALADIGRQVAGGFAAAQGAIGLFATDNEEMQQALLKSQSALALLMGTQELANFVTGQSAGKLALVSAAHKAYTFAVGTSTGALKAFRIALASTGIGLIIVAIGALIAGWDDLTAAIGKYINKSTDSRTEMEKVNDLMEAQNRIIQAKRKLMDAEFDLQEDSLEKQIAVADEKLKRELADINAQELMNAERNILIEAAQLRHQKALDDIYKKGGEELKKELDKQAEEERKRQADALALEQLRIQGMKDGLDKELAQENLAFKTASAQQAGNYKYLEELREQHKANLKAIQDKYDEAELLEEVNKQERQILTDQKFREDQEKEFAERLAAAKVQGEAFLEQQKKINQKQIEDDKRTQEARYSIASSTVSGLISLAELLGKAGEEQSDLQKGLAITQIAIDTAKAISGAVAQAQSVPYPANIAAVLSGVAVVLANIVQAKRILSDAGINSGSSTVASAAAPAPQAPAPQLQGSVQRLPSDFTGAEDTRVYVVESDITRTQNRVRRIERKATIK